MIGPRGDVVAVMLTHRGRMCLLRRSMAVASDRGRWHCVTGFVPAGAPPVAQAVTEVREETGLGRADLESFVAGPVLRLPDPRGGFWRVHSYRCETAHPRVTLNWENDDVLWIEPPRWESYPIVRWMPAVARALGCG